MIPCDFAGLLRRCAGYRFQLPVGQPGPGGAFGAELILPHAVGDRETVADAFGQQPVAENDAETAEIIFACTHLPAVFDGGAGAGLLAQRFAGQLRRGPQQKGIVGGLAGNQVDPMPSAE